MPLHQSTTSANETLTKKAGRPQAWRTRGVSGISQIEDCPSSRFIPPLASSRPSMLAGWVSGGWDGLLELWFSLVATGVVDLQIERSEDIGRGFMDPPTLCMTASSIAGCFGLPNDIGEVAVKTGRFSLVLRFAVIGVAGWAGVIGEN